MAAPSGHDKMAAELGEYVQVVVGEEEEQQPQQVVVLQGGISQEILQSLVQSDTVYYVQSDGSLLSGGSLGEGPGEAALQLKSVADQLALSQGAPSQVTRILNQKQLKSICVQVPGLSKESSEEASANIDDNISAPLTVTSDSASLAGARVMQVKTLTQQPQQIVVKSLPTPIQVVIPQQTKVPPPKRKMPDPNSNTGIESPDEHGCCVAHHRTADRDRKKGHKRKKAVKVKTRSGRISRPPKHKAKDYKFLKVGDSVQDSSVDSEDYSELSSEEEDDGTKEKVTRDRQPYTVKNSLFQCQTCEKSYMGKGGLFRHYRLYPAHGQMDQSFVSEARKNGDAVEQKKPRPRKRLLEDPINPNVSNPPTLVRDGVEIMPAVRAGRGRRQMPGRRFGRPPKILRNGTVGERPLSVKELVQQCGENDLKEQVAPSFSKIFSVYDFLLLKVKQDHPDKPLFPHVYREFEKLHSRVRELAEEYVRNMDQTIEQPLEVVDIKVAESLGIAENMTVKKGPILVITSEPEIPEEEEREESSDEESMPPSKRLKMDEEEDLAENVSDDDPASPAEEEQSGDLGQHGDHSLMSTSASDPNTDAASELVEHVTVTEDMVQEEEEVPEPLQTQTETVLEDLPSPDSTSASLSHDHPVNLSCQLSEDSITFQTCIPHSDIVEVVEAEQSVASHLPCEALTHALVSHEATNLDLPSEHSPPSIDCTQITDPTRTLIETSVPTALVEAACKDVQQVSYVEVGDALIPTTTTFTTRNVSEVTQAFSLSHGHELVFIHNAEDSATEEAVVIFDSAGAAETHLGDTVVALVEM
ncbi:zinc finger protein 839 [Hyperolius riggenbachi]|uniref:zinc finger protein 839 n=1 Tax=Hyperolius riggenbachi TaxID=752182 RepID=UPI0035A2F9D4